MSYHIFVISVHLMIYLQEYILYIDIYPATLGPPILNQHVCIYIYICRYNCYQGCYAQDQVTYYIIFDYIRSISTSTTHGTLEFQKSTTRVQPAQVNLDWQVTKQTYHLLSYVDCRNILYSTDVEIKNDSLKSTRIIMLSIYIYIFVCVTSYDPGIYVALPCILGSIGLVIYDNFDDDDDDVALLHVTDLCK